MNMRMVLYSLTGLLLLSFLFFINKETQEANTSINPLIGNISFKEKYGILPDVSVSEKVRIATHLEYMENFLRKKDVNHLNNALRLRRKQILDLLHTYWKNGEFPSNYDFPNTRKPCFIDKENNICAVGYLVAETAGRELAEKINAKYKYAFIEDMQSPELETWIAESGLTREEFAMIQPAYAHYDKSRDVNCLDKDYALATVLMTGLNVSAITLNALHLKGIISANKMAPIAGIISGTSSLVTGIALFNDKVTTKEYIGDAENPNPIIGHWVYYEETSERMNLSLINIGAGAASIILGTCNLLRQEKNPKPGKVTARIDFRQGPWAQPKTIPHLVVNVQL